MEPKGQYEILAGRRRTGAVKLNGGKEIMAIIRDVDDDEAAMIVTETNLRHREKLYHSEKAFAYKLQLEAIKRQGKRTDLDDGTTSAQIAQKFSRDIVAEKNEVSKDEIRRYIRLTCLIPQLLDLVDSEAMPFVAGVDLSYLDEPAQKLVHSFFFECDNGVKLDLKMAAALRASFKETGNLTPEAIKSLCHGKQKPNPSNAFSISRKKLLPYLDKLPDQDELERLFLEFLQVRFGNRQS
jgi:ParB family chromosome partitioning protein